MPMIKVHGERVDAKYIRTDTCTWCAVARAG